MKTDDVDMEHRVRPDGWGPFAALVDGARSLNVSNEWKPETRRGATEIILVVTPWAEFPDLVDLFVYLWGPDDLDKPSI